MAKTTKPAAKAAAAAATTPVAKTTPLTIKDLWMMTDKQKSDRDLTLSFTSLKAKAVQSVVDSNIQANNANLVLQAAKTDALKSGNFDNIVSASIAAQEANDRYTTVRAIYAKEFGEAPVEL